ncbi:cyanate hydratase [Puccinia sorghi]|uniref:Cyanate hydratase n=1 Tax=Puccinia sorghi TaxID=27349 RepID=A0A0L6VUU0_9BASI|nr:cyanate hydratase [Puccinia sorghi]
MAILLKPRLAGLPTIPRIVRCNSIASSPFLSQLTLDGGDRFLPQRLVEAKEAKELSFSEIAKKIGRSEVWTAALFYGQAQPEKQDLKKLSEVLEIPEHEFKKGFSKFFFPIRGTGVQLPPSDPTIYRLYEFLIVYGFPLKSIINEKFGDGIMSAIDFTCDVEKVEQDKAERVVITLNGKWLPYKRW